LQKKKDEAYESLGCDAKLDKLDKFPYDYSDPLVAVKSGSYGNTAFNVSEVENGSMYLSLRDVFKDPSLAEKAHSLEEHYARDPLDPLRLYDRPPIRHVMMLYGVDLPTEVGYVYRDSDSSGGQSSDKYDKSKGGGVTDDQSGAAKLEVPENVVTKECFNKGKCGPILEEIFYEEKCGVSPKDDLEKLKQDVGDIVEDWSKGVRDMLSQDKDKEKGKRAERQKGPQASSSSLSSSENRDAPADGSRDEQEASDGRAEGLRDQPSEPQAIAKVSLDVCVDGEKPVSINARSASTGFNVNKKRRVRKGAQHHSGDNTVPYISLSYAHTWLNCAWPTTAGELPYNSYSSPERDQRKAYSKHAKWLNQTRSKTGSQQDKQEQNASDDIEQRSTTAHQIDSGDPSRDSEIIARRPRFATCWNESRPAVVTHVDGEGWSPLKIGATSTLLQPGVEMFYASAPYGSGRKKVSGEMPSQDTQSDAKVDGVSGSEAEAERTEGSTAVIELHEVDHLEITKHPYVHQIIFDYLLPKMKDELYLDVSHPDAERFVETWQRDVVYAGDPKELTKYNVSGDMHASIKDDVCEKKLANSRNISSLLPALYMAASLTVSESMNSMNVFNSSYLLGSVGQNVLDARQFTVAIVMNIAQHVGHNVAQQTQKAYEFLDADVLETKSLREKLFGAVGNVMTLPQGMMRNMQNSYSFLMRSGRDGDGDGRDAEDGADEQDMTIQ
jgi:hypothetical protein